MQKAVRGSRLLKIVFVALLAQSTASAQLVTKDESQQIVLATSALTYWQKAPMSLLAYCGRLSPSTVKPAQAELIAWQRKNAEISAQVDGLLVSFTPLLGKYLKKSPDDLQVFMTRSTDEEVTSLFEKNFHRAEIVRHCESFGSFLSNMLSDHLVKPRVNIAIEFLRGYEKRVPALVADPKHKF